MTNQAVENAIAEAVAEQGSGILSCLTGEQRAALETKYNTLDEDIRSAYAAKYPALSGVELLAVRQLRKMANGQIASLHRPIWRQTLWLNAKSLQSKDAAVQGYGETQLKQLADELDTKESAALIKWYKQQSDRTSKDTLIVELCGIFGIEPATIK